jgi:cytochrome c oxidase subunit 1
VIFSGIAIGFMGWSVWVHHMFTVGLGPVATSAFAVSTMLIAVPTGVKIFNWVGTLHGGQISFKTPMMFSLGFIALFIIGGLSGVTHAVVPADTQQQDTYYVVAHFHYVLFGGALFGIFSGIYYWFPKFSGRLLNEGIGHWHFWLMFIGMNLTFAPMHIVGLNGMPRRIYTYPEGMGWDLWNMSASSAVNAPATTPGTGARWSGRSPRRRRSTTSRKCRPCARAMRSGRRSTWTATPRPPICRAPAAARPSRRP